ncbi:MAG: hypothetical protein NTV28_17855 [Propionibacteriales bacterium]|nr:hypothetical protein [Propionibacteriales bacterium]
MDVPDDAGELDDVEEPDVEDEVVEDELAVSEDVVELRLSVR